MCQIHKIHDAEDQRQSGCQQEQQDAKLQAVQALLEEKDPVHIQLGHVEFGKTHDTRVL